MLEETKDLFDVKQTDYTKEIDELKRLHKYIHYMEYGDRFIIVNGSQWETLSTEIKHLPNADNKINFIHVLDNQKRKAFFTTEGNIQYLLNLIKDFGTFYESVVVFYSKNRYSADARYEAYSKMVSAKDTIINNNEKDLAPLERKIIKGLMKYEDELNYLLENFDI